MSDAWRYVQSICTASRRSTTKLLACTHNIMHSQSSFLSRSLLAMGNSIILGWAQRSTWAHRNIRSATCRRRHFQHAIDLEWFYSHRFVEFAAPFGLTQQIPAPTHRSVFNIRLVLSRDYMSTSLLPIDPCIRTLSSFHHPRQRRPAPAWCLHHWLKCSIPFLWHRSARARPIAVFINVLPSDFLMAFECSTTLHCMRSPYNRHEPLRTIIFVNDHRIKRALLSCH